MCCGVALERGSKELARGAAAALLLLCFAQCATHEQDARTCVLGLLG